MHSVARSGVAIVAAMMLLAQPLFALQSPLSDESVREAYFLGQRHDGSIEGLIEKSTRRFPLPKSGPYVSSIMFVTPFLGAAQLSGSYIGNCSAQRAELDHRGAGKEIAKITVEIQPADRILRPIYRSGQRQFAIQFWAISDPATA